jgi:hypothetical protein
MCNLYKSTPRETINMRHLVQLPEVLSADTIAPLKPGPYVMAPRRQCGWAMGTDPAGLH